MVDSPPPEIRVLVVDRDGAVAAALATMLGRMPDVEVAGVADSAPVAAEIVEADATIDVAVVDAALDDISGPELCRRLRERRPQLHCILHVAGSSPVPDASTRHVDAVVPKQLVGDELLQAIRSARG